MFVLLLWSGRLVAQTPVIRIDDAGPGVGSEILARALAAPHAVVGPGTTRYVVSRSAGQSQSLVVLSRDVVVEGRVRGDLLVIGGDLYMHPGGSITGAATVIGGGIYESTLATISGPARAFRDFTYDAAPIDGGYALRYRALVPPPAAGLSLPGIFGITFPSYDRTNGVSIGVAPRYSVAGAPLIIVPQVTYRSQLGQFDPTIAAEYGLDDRTLISVAAGRFTRSNERWIRSDPINSLGFLWDGSDARNYYRASRVDARVTRAWESASGMLAPYLGLSVERGRSVRPDSFATSAPWTLFNRSDSDRDQRFRANPAIDPGDIQSALAGLTWAGSQSGLVWELRADGELGSLTHAQTRGTQGFGQLALDGGLAFPTFASQWLELGGHAVTSAGSAPRQRWAYLGGSGTIPTLTLLEEGGDQLLFLGGTYQIPINRVQLPFLGPPIVGLREILGGAANGKFPTIHQAMGVRVTVRRVFAEFLYDPDLKRGHAGVGFSFGR